MNGNARDKVFKSWSGISEVALIKEVATKGEHISLCIEYWAKKRKMPVPEYELFFHDVVQTYVQRLLSERLVHKAENVLRNVQRDIKCCYFQYACESNDEELRELLLDYLQKHDPQDFAQDMQQLQFYWELLQQLHDCPELAAKCKSQLRRLNLENLMASDAAYKNQLVTELFYTNRNTGLLQQLNKAAVWTYLLETEKISEIIRWCYLSSGGVAEEADELELMYAEWTLEPHMYEQALKSLLNPDEVLRNCFVKAGYFWADERDVVPTVLRRICTTESFSANQQVLERLPFGGYLLQQGHYHLMLREIVSARELEELADRQPAQRKLLEFIVTLKNHSLEKSEDFEKVAYSTKSYLESQDVDFQNAQPLVTFFEFLCNEPTVASLNCFLHSSALKHVPYLISLARKFSENSNASSSLPTAYDLLRKFRGIDFKEIYKDTQGVASFSNERLCQKYARNYQLNFLHYLKQNRSAFAVYYLITEQLQHYAQITRTQLFNACETVTEFALQHATNADLVTHCVAFCEMLCFDTQRLRTFLKLSRLVARECVPSFGFLVTQAEQLLMERLLEQPDRFPLADYQALMRMVDCNQQRQWPAQIMQHYTTKDDWWCLLVLLQYFEVPLAQVQQYCKHFRTPTIGEHLCRALAYDVPPTNERSYKRTNSARQTKQQTRKAADSQLTTSFETLRSYSSNNDGADPLKGAARRQLRFLPDSSGELDLFALILLSNSTANEERIPSTERFLELMQDTQIYCTSWNLMKNCVKYRMPVLSLLSATVSDMNVEWNWIVSLAVATDQWQELLRVAIKDVQEFIAWHIIENCVRLGFTATLYRSFCLFFAQHPLKHLFKFLHQTEYERDFGNDVVHELCLYLLAWSNDEVQLPLSINIKREQLMLRTIKLLLLHLQENFDSTLEQQRFLDCICRSDMSDISGLLDFCRLKEVFNILQGAPNWSQRFPIRFEQLLQRGKKEYTHLLSVLIEAKEYDVSIRLATLLQMPICDIVYSKWVTSVDVDEAQGIPFQTYENEIVEHALPPEILVNFFLYAALRIPEACKRKYLLLKRALNVIKKHHLFPNESFDRDQIEYEMIVCYLQIEDSDEVEQLEIYHSEYFEQIMLNERCVLYKSFLELKELAGIEDLSTSLKTELTEQMQQRLERLLMRLLDEGDIVEALRLQELFECRPIDLRFVVFCMALAEGFTTIFSMSSEERQLLRDIEKSSFAKFNRRTLDTIRKSGSPQGYSSPIRVNNDFSDSCSTLEFEEIPSKEKRETLDTIQGIASKLKCGMNIGKRIVMAYRAAMYLDKEYLDVLRTKDTSVLLKSVAEEGCLHRLLVVSDILTSTNMTAQEIAELLAYEITTAVVRPRFYIFNVDHQSKNSMKNADLWGYNIDRDLHLFLELTPNTTKLGNCLLQYCDALKEYRKYQDNRPYDHSAYFEKLTEIIALYGLPTATSAAPFSSGPPQVLSHKKQNLIYVEILIKAHQSFVHECSMEGIANVLNRAKSLNTKLAYAKSWSLIVRMLIGIARYREMFYCFDTLIENEQFESLLGQFDDDKTIGLRQAILSYLREYAPENSKELLKLAGLHFLMYKDLAEMWSQDAQEVLDKVLATAKVSNSQLTEQHSMANVTAANTLKIVIPKLRSSTAMVLLLNQALENYTHATENYLLDNKLLLAQKCASRAELVAMQIDLANKTTDKNTAVQHCACVLNVQSREDFRELVNSELNVPQAMILGRAYGHDINWTEVLLAQYIILQKTYYLQEYLVHMPITDTIIDNIIKGFQLYAQHHKTSMPMEENLAHLVDLVKSITLKYKLASLLSLKSNVMSLINDQTMHYLKDTNYGRCENYNMSNI